ncbi:MAG: hypothetical protein WKF35_07995 [Ferruginibacter sp.]
MDKWILKAMLGFIKIFSKKDVDFERLKIIAETKVLMDRRRAPASFRQKQRKEPKNPLLITLIIYTILGIFMSLMIIFIKSFMVSMIFLHAYLLFIMAMTLITDFSSVLLDTTDNQIILPKPVNSRTLFLARVVHILTYLLQFTIALTVFPLAVTFVKFGILSGILLSATLLLTVAFSMFFTYLLYGLILRFGNEQKIKDIVGYFQIFMTVFFAVGYQVIPRLINFENLNYTFTLYWYSYLLPPVWMAMALDAMHQFNFDSIHLLMIFCAFVIPVFCTWLMIKYLAPSFSRKLAALSNNNEAAKKNVTGKKFSKDLSEKLSRVMCVTQTESAGFEKVWKMTGRDKNFKLQFYPSLAYLLVFAFIFVFKSGKNISEIWNTLSSTKMFLWFVYLPMFSIASSLSIVAFHENYLASWIYQSTPITKPGEIISGMLKALMLKFFVPVYFILFIFSLYVWGYIIIDDFILGFFNNVLIYLLMASLSRHYLPFSRQPAIKEQAGKFVQIILQFLIIALLIGTHYLALKIYWLPGALIPFSIVTAYLLLKKIQQLPWLKISN